MNLLRIRITASLNSLGLMGLLFMVPLPSLHAVSATWLGTNSGDWTDAGNWQSAVPGTNSNTSTSGDTATFDNSTNTTITVDPTRSIGGLNFKAGAGAFTFDTGTIYFSMGGGAGTAGGITIDSGVTNNQIFNTPLSGYRPSGAGGFGFTNNSASAALTLNGGITGSAIAGSNTTLNLDGTGSGTIHGAISDGAGGFLTITKVGTGTWTFTNSNTYTGQTSLAEGTIVLDFNGASSPTDNIINSSTLLYLGRSVTVAASRTLGVVGKADTANTQTFNNFSLLVGATNLDLGTSGTGSLVVDLGAMTATARSSGVTFNINAPAGTLVKTSTANANATVGILPQATTLNGTDFASNDGSGNVVAYTGYTANTATTLGSAQTQIIDMSGGDTTLTGGGATTMSGLRFNTASDTTLTMDSNRMLTFYTGSAGAILVTPNVGNHLSRITGGLLSGNSSRDLVLLQNNTLGDLQIDAPITSVNNNGLGLTKSGAGKVILTGQNAYSANSIINEGTVVVTADGTVGNTQSLTTTAASATLTSVDTTGLFIGQRVTGANIPGTGQGLYITAIDSGAGTVTLNSGTGVLGGTADVNFGNTGGLGTLLAGNAVQIGATATLQIGNGGTTGGLVANQGVTNYGTLVFNRSNNMNFSNPIYNRGTVVQAGGGTTTLPGTQFYTGDTIIENGTLEVLGDVVAAQSGVAGTRTAGSPVITNVPDTSNLRVGQPISGSGISTTAAPFILSIDSATQITMSSNATSNNTSVNLAFAAGGGVGSGAVTINGGTLLVNGTGSINNSTGVTVAGGTLRYDSTTALDRNVTLSSGKFSYNSSNDYAGILTFTGGTIGGSNISNLNLTIGTGQTMSPGNSTGTMAAGDTTWATGGTFLFELNDTTGTAGSASLGWDLLNASTLDITAGVGEFNIQIASLDALQAAGNALNFDGNSNYTWLMVDAGSAITGFDAGSFILDDSAFTNAAPGTFSITQGTGGDVDKLYLNYTGVIPEPTTYAMLLGGLGLLAFLRRRSKS